jgi:hypothetical protein
MPRLPVAVGGSARKTLPVAAATNARTYSTAPVAGSMNARQLRSPQPGTGRLKSSSVTT